MRTSFARTLVLCAALGALTGCPEERPGATREIPTQRIPPAVSLEPPPQASPGTAQHSIAGPGGAAPTASPQDAASPSAPASPGRRPPTARPERRLPSP